METRGKRNKKRTAQKDTVNKEGKKETRHKWRDRGTQHLYNMMAINIRKHKYFSNFPFPDEKQTNKHSSTILKCHKLTKPKADSESESYEAVRENNFS